MRNTYEFEVRQDGMPVAATFGDDRERALGEAWGYATQYAQDGEVTIVEVLPVATLAQISRKEA